MPRNTKNNKRNNNKNNKRRTTRRRAPAPRRSMYDPLYIKPDHRIVVKYIGNYAYNNVTSGYFDCYDDIHPHKILATSAYAPLLDIYESVRVTKIEIKTWLGSASMNVSGYTAAMHYRDIVPTDPQRFVEQLIVEPGSKTGRPITKFSFLWRPIEPTDYEFYDHTQFAEMDNNKYGQLNYAGASFPSGFEIGKPLLEYKVYYDFKSLIKPPVVSSFHNNNPEYQDDSDIEVVPSQSRPETAMTKSSINELVRAVTRLTTK